MNKINILTIAMLAASLSLSGCGGSGSASNNDHSTEIKITVNSEIGDIYTDSTFEISTLNVNELSASYGTITKQESSKTSDDSDLTKDAWLYTISTEQLRNITEFPYTDVLYYTTTDGKQGSKNIRINPANIDPLLVQQWHISNNGYNYFDTSLAPQKGIDLNVINAWAQKDSQGRNITGKGVKVIVFDDHTDFSHEDLPQPYTPDEIFNIKVNQDLPMSAIAIDKRKTHGTMVSGIIGARANNGLGGRGIAYDTDLSSLYYQYNNLYSYMLIANPVNVDIVNASFLYLQSLNYAHMTTFLEEAYENNIPFIKANGNYFDSSAFQTIVNNKDCKNKTHTSEPVDCTFVQISSLERSPYNIMVGAINSQGKRSSYSSTGSNLWISAFGGEFGNDKTKPETSAAIVTTLSSYNLNQDLPQADFDNNTPWRNNQNVHYTAKMNGTSSAAPEITGIVALIKQARPTVTIPQIKYILAKTARNNSDIANMDYLPIYDDNGLLVEQGWITNNAGWKFSKYYGFGLADAGKAVELALNCDKDPLCKQKNDLPLEYVSSNSNPCKALDDENGRTVTECDFTYFASVDDHLTQLPNNAQIDNVSVYLDCLPIKDAESASVANPYTQFELISNNGTKSIVKNMYSNWDYFHTTNNTNSETNLTSSAFYHETLSDNDTYKFKIYSQYPIDVNTINSTCNIKLHIWAYENNQN